MAAFEYLLQESRIQVIQWTLTTADPTGDPYILSARFPDKTVHMFGTFGGSTVVMRGSNEIVAAPTSWLTLHDPTVAGLISLAEDGIKQILENPYQISPALTGGAGATVRVILCLSVPVR